MTSTILYFSATGNTHWAARQLQARLEAAGETAACLPFEQIDTQPLPPGERLLLGFPVYGFRVPALFRRRILDSIDLKGREVYLFATLAVCAGDALADFADELRTAGAVVIGARTVKMPGSDAMGFMRPDSAALRKMLDRDFDHLPELDGILRDLQEPQLPPARFARGSPLRLSSPKRLLFRLARVVMARMEAIAIRRLHADDACTRCGLCARICPAGNITMGSDGPVFGDRCLLCLRCLHHCPAQAVQIASWTRGKFRYPGPGPDPFRPARLFVPAPD